MIKEIKIPFINPNDKEVIIAEIIVSNGQYVKKGDIIFSVETTKSLVDVESEFDGFIWLKDVKGEKMFNGTLIGVITDYEDFDFYTYLGEYAKPETSPQKLKATKKALQLAERNNLDIEFISVNNRVVVTEKDVLNYIKKKANIINKENCFLFEGNIDRVKFENELLRTDLNEISENEWIGFYSKHGAKIDASVKVGKNVFLIGKEIIVEEGCKIGSNVTIRADRIKISKYSCIGNNLDVTTGFFELGESTVIADNVKVDLSGGKNADSIFRTGSNCLIANEVYLNTCRKIELKNKVALSPRAMIFTHSFWQSVFDGYTANFGPVLLKNESWLGAASQVLPNVIIEKGVIVMSGSVVVENLPQFVFASGIPAKKVKENIKKKLTQKQKNIIATSLVFEFIQYCIDCSCVVEKIDENNFLISFEGKNYQLIFEEKLTEIEYLNNTIEHRIILFFTGELSKRKSKSTYFDLGRNEVIGENIPLVSELRNFLRRRGIIFAPNTWRFNIIYDSIKRNN